MKNKKGAELTIGTIIIIILAIVVLVFLIYGFTTGWGNLWDKISNWGGGSSNVQTILQGCQVACSTNAQYDYENLQREVILADNTNFKATCKDLESGMCMNNGKLATGTVDPDNGVSTNGVRVQTNADACTSQSGAKWQEALISPKCATFA